MKLKRAKVCFHHVNYALGDVHPKFDRIRIDLKRNTNPIRTYIHEQLHLKHRDWKEWKVLKIERRIWKRLTQEQVRQLGKRLFSRKGCGR